MPVPAHGDEPRDRAGSVVDLSVPGRLAVRLSVEAA